MQEILAPLAKPRLPEVPDDKILKNSINLAPQDHKLLTDICAAIHGTLLRKKAIIDSCKMIVGPVAAGKKAAENVFAHLIAHPDETDEDFANLVHKSPEALGLINQGSIIGHRAKPHYFEDKRTELVNSCNLYRTELFRGRSPEQCAAIQTKIDECGRKPSAGMVFGMLVELGLAASEGNNIRLARIDEGDETRTVSLEIRASAWQQVRSQHIQISMPNYAIVAGLLRLAYARYTLRDLVLEAFTCPLMQLKKS